MPYIIKNGLTYTGNSVTLTQAQYDVLSEAEKNNGVAYYIYDSDAVLDASDVGLGEGNVEDLAGSVAVIETSRATATHAVGDFILWNGQLYSVIAPIQVGQDLTVGSNITATNAGSELTSLKSGLSQKYRVDFFDNNDVSIETGWQSVVFNNATVSGYSPIGIVGCACTFHAPFVNSMNGHLLGGTPSLSVNANTSSTADFRIWVLFQKNV